MRNVLIIAPHADDAEFGLGMAIQMLTKVGDSVRVVILAHGDYFRADGLHVPFSRRQEEARAGLSLLGVQPDNVAFTETFQENAGPDVPLHTVVSAIEAEIKAREQHLIFTCLPSFNQDHQTTFQAFVAACRPGVTGATLAAYEYPGNSWGARPPSWGKRYYVGTDKDLRLKYQALWAHESQFLGREAVVCPKAAVQLARARGAEVGATAAELVYLMREIIS